MDILGTVGAALAGKVVGNLLKGNGLFGDMFKSKQADPWVNPNLNNEGVVFRSNNNDPIAQGAMDNMAPSAMDAMMPTSKDGKPMSKLSKDELDNLINSSLQETNSSLPPDYLRQMAYVESRGNPKATSPTGAKGLFQFVGSTWKQYGEGDPYDPKANTVAAIKLAESNKKYLESKLGRQVTNAELYMAHNIGAGGALRLLSAPRDATVSKDLIGSKPEYNPLFYMDGNKPVTAGEAIQRYADHFAI